VIATAGDAPDTLSGLARAQASRASIVLEARTGNWWPRSSFSEAPRHRSSFLKLSYSPSLGYPPQSAARTSKTQPGAGRPPGGEVPRREGSRRLRIDPETYTRAETRPLDFTTRTASQSFANLARARTHEDTRRRRATGRSAPRDITPTTRHRSPRQPDTRQPLTN
jgi:hypothetical protein